MTYKPLEEGLAIKQSDIHGHGLFATREWAVGEMIGITHVQDERFQDGWSRTPTGGFLNHSEIPNVKIVTDHDMKRGKVLRHIREGEELTTLYHLYAI